MVKDLTWLRQEMTEMANGLVVLHEDGTPYPETAAELTVWLRHLASLNDEALGRALS